ncbi:MAG: hypothetical protein K4571_12060 [Deltaproteobacteria bacterium]
MDSVSAYFSSNPAAFTLLAIFVIVLMLFFILKKFLKLTIVFLFIVLLAAGIYLFSDPAAMPDKIKQSVENFKSGSEQIGDKFSNLFEDSKKLAGKAKDVPMDLNKMLDTAKKDVGK